MGMGVWVWVCTNKKNNITLKPNDNKDIEKKKSVYFGEKNLSISFSVEACGHKNRTHHSFGLPNINVIGNNK